MIFRDFNEQLLGSKVKLKLLSHLLAPYSDGQFFALPPASQRELAQLVGVSHTAVANAFEDFYNANLVSPSHVGSSKMWIINGESYAFEVLTRAPLTELFRQPPLLRLESLIRSAFSKHRNVVEMAVIYGSIPRFVESRTSDVDIMLLLKVPPESQVLQKEIEDLSTICRKLFGNMLSVTKVEPGFAASRPPWFSEALDTGIKVMI